jgi:hypothetical protein
VRSGLTVLLLIDNLPAKSPTQNAHGQPNLHGFIPFPRNSEISIQLPFIKLVIDGFYLFVVWISDASISELFSPTFTLSFHSSESWNWMPNNHSHSANNRLTFCTMEIAPIGNFEEWYSTCLTGIAWRDMYSDLLFDFDSHVHQILKTSTRSPPLPLQTKLNSFEPISSRKLKQRFSELAKSLVPRKRQCKYFLCPRNAFW